MNPSERLMEICAEYSKILRVDLRKRISDWMKDLTQEMQYAAIGGLLARQTTLASEISKSPYTWNPHIAPILHRAMIDVYINLAWILEKPDERSKKYIEFGLGQAKLGVEHRKEQLRKDGVNPDEDRVVKAYEGWIDEQKLNFLVEVNVGAWSGLTTRAMAEESGCIDLYNYAYSPFSPCVHSMWHHVGRYNVRRSENPLHRNHFIPTLFDINPGIDDLLLAAKYMDKASKLFDEKIFKQENAPPRKPWLEEKIAELGDAIRESEKEAK